MLLPGGSYPRYSSTGHIVYAIDGTLRAVPFDLERLEVTGTAVPVLDGVVTKDSGAADFALSRDGTLVYVSGATNRAAQVGLGGPHGARGAGASARARLYISTNLAGRHARRARHRDQEQDIWTWDLAGQTLTRLTFGSAADMYPVWSPDSRRLIFASARAGASNLFWQAADGTGAVERLTESPNAQVPNAITPDGSRIVFREIAIRRNERRHADAAAASAACGASGPDAVAGAERGDYSRRAVAGLRGE